VHVAIRLMDEQFEVRAEQGVDADEDVLARVVTSCGDSNADRDHGAPVHQKLSSARQPINSRRSLRL